MNRAKPAATSILLKGCTKSFASSSVQIGPLDIEIAAGERVSILGPSGCGKTTTLRMIAGLEMPDRGGSILFGDDDVTSLPIEKRNVGMVFQNYALFPNFDVRGNIGYGLRVRGTPKAERDRRVDDMIAMMRLDVLSGRRIDELSGGQKQRVALARALILEPRALLFDEALTALDAQLRETLRMEIAQLLQRLDVTAIYVTHDQAEAMSLGDRVIVMDHGRIAQSGTPREIYHRPATRFVAEFIGTMNRVPGAMRGDSFICAAGAVTAPHLPADCREVMFRPEHVTLLSNAEGDKPGLNGSVVATFFLGDRTRLLVGDLGPQPVIVETIDPREFAIGDQVRLAIQPQALMAL